MLLILSCFVKETVVLVILASLCEWLGRGCRISIRNLKHKTLALLSALVCFMHWYFFDVDSPRTSVATDLRDVWVSLDLHI